MPPEQAEGRTDEMGPTSDVYSLGATLYSVTGRRRMRRTNRKQRSKKVQQGVVKRPREVNADVPVCSRQSV